MATTNLVGDLVKEVGGTDVRVDTLMRAGVDPHLYKAGARDVRRLVRAQVIFYGGLALEGRMADLFEEMGRTRVSVAVTRDMRPDHLITADDSETAFDPHVWFDVGLWKTAAGTVAEVLISEDPANADNYRRRLADYLDRLDALDRDARQQISRIPAGSRVLVTSHDAFAYLGRRYGITVVPVQGISTASEATPSDIKRVADVIATRRVKTVFIETSVPRQTIEAVLAEAAHRGYPARVGAELFSDSAGQPGTPEGTYIGMFRHNVNLIVRGLA